MRDGFDFFLGLALASVFSVGAWGFGGVLRRRRKTSSSREVFVEAAMTASAEGYSPTPIMNIPDDFLRAIGKVSICWGILESVIDLSVSKLAGFQMGDERSAIVTAHMTWPLKMDILESFTNSLVSDHPHLADFPKIKPLLKKAQEGRNRVAHGSWGYDDGKVVKARATARGKLKVSIDEITLADLEAISLNIHRAGVAVIMLVLNKNPRLVFTD